MHSMTKDLYDIKPNVLLKSPLRSIADPDEMRGIVLFLGSDASTLCTGIEYVFRFAFF